jgi:hypothetical protein
MQEHPAFFMPAYSHAYRERNRASARSPAMYGRAGIFFRVNLWTNFFNALALSH